MPCAGRGREPVDCSFIAGDDFVCSFARSVTRADVHHDYLDGRGNAVLHDLAVFHRYGAGGFRKHAHICIDMVPDFIKNKLHFKHYDIVVNALIVAFCCFFLF